MIFIIKNTKKKIEKYKKSFSELQNEVVLLPKKIKNEWRVKNIINFKEAIMI